MDAANRKREHKGKIYRVRWKSKLKTKSDQEVHRVEV